MTSIAVFIKTYFIVKICILMIASSIYSGLVYFVNSCIYDAADALVQPAKYVVDVIDFHIRTCDRFYSQMWRIFWSWLHCFVLLYTLCCHDICSSETGNLIIIICMCNTSFVVFAHRLRLPCDSTSCGKLKLVVIKT